MVRHTILAEDAASPGEESSSDLTSAVAMPEHLRGRSGDDVSAWTPLERVEARLWLARGLQTDQISISVGVKLMKLLDAEFLKQTDETLEADPQAMIETKVF